jgi:hypothetical protein
MRVTNEGAADLILGRGRASLRIGSLPRRTRLSPSLLGEGLVCSQAGALRLRPSGTSAWPVAAGCISGGRRFGQTTQANLAIL